MKADAAATTTPVSYKTHVQTYGWEQAWKKDGQTSGTTGKSKRLEGIYIKLDNAEAQGSIQYRTHIQTYGWEKGWKNAGRLSGTTGKSKRLEAIQIRLTGQLAEQYDIYYRVHAQKFGWMGWAKNGASAGTAGYAYRLEAIQIKLVAKGGNAPGSAANTFKKYPEPVKTGYQNPAQYYQVSARTVTLPAKYKGTGYNYVTPSRISASATREQCVEAMIKRAYEYKGDKYKWGNALQPGKGIDCSGLVIQSLYACGMETPYNPWVHKFDHSMDPTTDHMLKDGKFKKVKVSERKRGDLIFYGKNGNATHVGIYLGNDKIINARNPKVSVNSVWHWNIVGVVRPFV